MRMLKLPLLVAPLVLAGCILTTGQITVDFELDVGFAQHDVGIDGSCVDVGILPELFRDLQRRLGESFQAVAIDTNRHGCFDPALQHHHAPVDRLQGRRGRDAGQRRDRVDLVPDVVNGDTVSPLVGGPWPEAKAGVDQMQPSSQHGQHAAGIGTVGGLPQNLAVKFGHGVAELHLVESRLVAVGVVAEHDEGLPRLEQGAEAAHGRRPVDDVQADPDARVVILSSLGAQNDIEECLKMGARSYLQKPIDPEAMERVLRDALA